MVAAFFASSRASELPAAHLRCPVRARPGIHNHRTSLLRRSSATRGPRMDSAVWVIAFARTTPTVRLNRFPRVRHRRGEAAVDGECLAVDIGRLVACEEQAHRRDLVRLAGALQGIELTDLVLRAALLGAVEHRLGHAGLDQARTDRVDADAGAGERIGRGLHQRDDAGLARRIRMAAGARLQARDGGGADDRAGLLLDHVRHDMFHRQEWPDQVDPQDLLPMLHSLLGDRHQSAGDAGIGPDRVDFAIGRERLVDEADNVLLRAGISLDGFRGAAGLADLLDGLRHAVAAVDRDQPGAFLREQKRRRAADAAAGAGDDDGFAFEPAHELLPNASRFAEFQTRFQTSKRTPKSLETTRALTYEGFEQY